MPEQGDGDLAEVVAAERALLDPRVRGDRARVEPLLHADFVEFGSSGRRWDRGGDTRDARRRAARRRPGRHGRPGRRGPARRRRR
ncbi:MAG: nuclear transport factor 2 family protein, partial [Streptosporangiales bacterium]|nr:nuclear transport factor 2 family protein [Streptosporangiales bacterium]